MNFDHFLRPLGALALSLTPLFVLPACEGAPAQDESDAGETGGEQALELIGEYTDEWGDTHTITESSWQNAAGTFTIAEYDNDGMWLVAQNATTNEYYPDMWSRFEWLWEAEDLYYCQAVFDGATRDDALAGSADPADLEMGCGGFSWTRLE